MSVSHVDLVADQIHTPFRWVQEGDPGGGTGHAGHVWVKLSTAEIRRRKSDDSGWDILGGTPGGIVGTIFDAKGDILTATADNTPARLAVGANGKHLTANSGEATGLEWVTHDSTGDPHTQYTTNAEATTIADTEALAAVALHEMAADPHTGYVKESVVTAKGDLYVATASGVVTRLAVGPNGYVLTADSGATPGVAWAAAAGGGGGTYDVYANLPAPGSAGDLYLPSDAPVILVDNGAAWQAFGSIHRFTLTAKPTTWFNQLTNSITSRTWGDFMYCPDIGGTGTPNIRGREKTYPTPPFTLDIAMQFVGYNRQYTQYGLMTRDSASGRIVTFGPSINTLYVLRYNSETSINGVEEQAELMTLPVSVIYFRIVDNATLIQYWWSANGEDWINFRTTLSRTFWLASPNKIGFFVNNQTSFFPVGVTLLSWYEH